MTMPKATDNWCRRKTRRLHRRGEIGCFVSTVSRDHPLATDPKFIYISVPVPRGNNPWWDQPVDNVHSDNQELP